MNARTFLARAWMLEQQVQSGLEQMEALKSLAARVNFALDRDRVKTSLNPSAMADWVHRLIEAEGIHMPVISLSCDYKAAARYGDLAEIRVRLVLFNGARLRCEYEVRLKETGTLLASGRSEHCYVDAATGRPLNLKRRMPEYCRVLAGLTKACGGEA